MSTKTITITEEAYNRLKARKKRNESFSDVINREFNESSIWELAGILSDEEAEDMRKHVKELRDSMDERVEETARELK